MNSTVKAGGYMFRINPSNPKELQRSTNGSSWSFVTSFGGGKILDLDTDGDDVVAITDKGRYIRKKSGTVEKK